MTAKRKTSGPPPDIFDDPNALVALAKRSFATAKRAALAENDRLGVTSHGAKDGQLTSRPPKAAKPAPR